MRKPLSFILLGIVIGSILSLTLEYYLSPVRTKISNPFAIGKAMGAKEAQDEIIAKIEKEFNSTKEPNSTDQVLFSSNEKVVLLKEKNYVKTLSVHER